MKALTGGVHPLAWAIWLMSAMVIVLVTSNPLYHATVAICALLVYANVRPAGRRPLDAFLLAGWLFALLSIPLNLLTGSIGATELFVLPSIELPGWLGSVTLGGSITAESLLYAVDQALSIAALISIVCAFNAGVDHFQLLKLTPPGLAQLGIVVSVGLLLIPETMARARALREARTTRGYGGRLSPVMLIPLLSDALERAVQRAEVLDARGFGALSTASRTNESLLALAGLLLAAFGAYGWYYAPDERTWAIAAVCTGGAVVALAGWRQASRGVARRLFVQPASYHDILVAASALAAVSVVTAMRVAGIGDVTYLPFPELHAPGYSVGIVAALLLLLAPALRGAR